MAEIDLLTFFKALADANRLKIVGLLSQEALSVEQLAAMLQLRPSTISHHLSRLAEAGLVTARAEGYYSVYSLEVRALQEMARRLLSAEALPEIAVGLDRQAYANKVIADFSTTDGRLKTIPAQHKKLLAILDHVVRAFEPGRRYAEPQVNEILRRFHDDTARLRRELVGAGLMARQSGEYWRTAEAA
jgi:DNA-binding transcriptional ArsR family regulator